MPPKTIRIESSVVTWNSRRKPCGFNAGDWIGTVYALLGLVAVVPVWFIASIAEGIASLWPRRLPSRHLLLFSFLVLWATGWTVAATAFDIGSVVISGGVCDIVLIAILAAKGLVLRRIRRDSSRTYAQTFPQTTWRLCDPNLLTSGVWRAEVRSTPWNR